MKPRPGYRARLAIALAVILVASLGALAWRLAGSNRAGGARTVVVTRGTLKAAIETSGKLTARRSTSVTSSAGGTVRVVAVREGEPVRRGDVLAALDDGPARAEVARAERAVELAETQIGVARARAAADPTQLPGIAAAERDATEARAGLDAANAKLAATLLLAPFDGIVATVKLAEGAAYQPGAEGLTVVDPADLVVTGDLDEVDRPLVGVGQEATVTVLAFPGRPLTGRVASLSDVAQTRGGTTIFPLAVEFERPADLALLPGMGVELRIVTQAREAVLLLPSAAVRRAGERQYVTVRRDGRDVEVEVRTGARSGGDVEIVSGLDEGEVVVLP